MDAGKESDLQSLLERLEKATGPDREIDQDIEDIVRLGIAPRDKPLPFCPKYTSSLDAALSLVERVLPPLPTADHKHSEIRLQIADGDTNAVIDRDTFSGEAVTIASAATPALALCLALVRAKLEDEKGNDRE